VRLSSAPGSAWRPGTTANGLTEAYTEGIGHDPEPPTQPDVISRGYWGCLDSGKLCMTKPGSRATSILQRSGC
jgi:hypothetical protein